jgi:hypothetical protein
MSASVFALATFPICVLLASVLLPASSVLTVALLLLVSVLTFLLAALTTASITIAITVPLREGCWIRSDKHPKAEQHRQTNTNENTSC